MLSPRDMPAKLPEQQCPNSQPKKLFQNAFAKTSINVVHKLSQRSFDEFLLLFRQFFFVTHHRLPLLFPEGIVTSCTPVDSEMYVGPSSTSAGSGLVQGKGFSPLGALSKSNECRGSQSL